ncbi:MAG: NADH-quinone oxidoreductase subunit N [Ignavibacterium sp.]|nr:NADH-quinone oxidoreductase subunit N [Ignavibacterium sp.]MDW8376336.1 NADH-quinone oxidoreductase subunit N [Ignavibacteriales bacterium]
MFNNIQEFYNFLPMILIAAGILVSITVELFYKKSISFHSWFSIILFFVVGVISLVTINAKSVILQNMVATGGYVNIFYALFNFTAMIVCLLSIDYLKKYEALFGEYYILIQTSVLGMMLMAAAKDLFVIFLGLELMSVSFYVLAGINRKRSTAIEASLKYFLLGAFATGFIVYGIALIYGTAQSTSIDVITNKFIELSNNLLFLSGVLLFLIGFSFKVAAFPFHQWVPDVYQGSPSTISALFSTAGKTAAFAAIIVSLFAIFTSGASKIITPYLSVVSVLSMFFGSIVALSQTNIKRMLAYSSIANAGYLLIGLAASNSEGIAGVIFYLTAYSLMNLGAFGIVSIIESKEERNLEINDYAGLSNKQPLLAALLSLFMFSLAGIPPFAGFFGKYYIFMAAIKSDLTILAILGVLSSVISVYFYLRLVVLMYFKDSETELGVSKTNSGLIALYISVLLVILLGIFPGSFLGIINSAL